MKCYFHGEVIQQIDAGKYQGVLAWSIPELKCSGKEVITGDGISFPSMAATRLLQFLRANPKIGHAMNLEVLGDDKLAVVTLESIASELSAMLGRQVGFQVRYISPEQNPCVR